VHVTATIIEIFINIVSTLLSVDLVGQIGFTFHVVTPFFSLIITTLVILADNGLLVLEEPCKTSLCQLEENQTDTLTVASL